MLRDCDAVALSVRPATMDDAEATRAIYNPEVQESTVTFDLVPRSLEQQQEWLRARSGAHVVLVAEDSAGEVVGFASLSPYKDRPAYSTTVEDSVYVRRDQRGTGVGRLLLGELVSVATSHGFHAMMARIVGDHEASIRLHTSLGFELVGREREVGRKFGRWLDVVVLQRLL
jgi:phosphinothricin acetyltransferase